MTPELEVGLKVGDLEIIEMPEQAYGRVKCRCICGKEPVLRQKAQLRRHFTHAVESACKTCVKKKTSKRLDRNSLSAGGGRNSSVRVAP